MKEQITFVLALHSLDQKIDTCQFTLEKAGPELEEQHHLVEATKKTLEEKTAQLGELEKSKQQKEREVETSNIRARDFQGKLSQIKTNKEYQAALKEIAETKKTNKSSEDQILECMTQIDALKAEKEELEKTYQAALATFEEKKRELGAETEKMKDIIQEVELEKNKLCSQIEGAVLSQYQRVRKNRREAVTEVVRGTCQGCNMRIPPQLLIEIQKLERIHVCPACSRILYMPEWTQEKGEVTL